MVKEEQGGARAAGEESVLQGTELLGLFADLDDMSAAEIEAAMNAPEVAAAAAAKKAAAPPLTVTLDSTAPSQSAELDGSASAGPHSGSGGAASNAYSDGGGSGSSPVSGAAVPNATYAAASSPHQKPPLQMHTSSLAPTSSPNKRAAQNALDTGRRVRRSSAEDHFTTLNANGAEPASAAFGGAAALLGGGKTQLPPPLSGPMAAMRGYVDDGESASAGPSHSVPGLYNDAASDDRGDSSSAARWPRGSRGSTEASGPTVPIGSAAEVPETAIEAAAAFLARAEAQARFGVSREQGLVNPLTPDELAAASVSQRALAISQQQQQQQQQHSAMPHTSSAYACPPAQQAPWAQNPRSHMLQPPPPDVVARQLAANLARQGVSATDARAQELFAGLGLSMDVSVPPPPQLPAGIELSPHTASRFEAVQMSALRAQLGTDANGTTDLRKLAMQAAAGAHVHAGVLNGSGGGAPMRAHRASWPMMLHDEELGVGVSGLQSSRMAAAAVAAAAASITGQSVDGQLPTQPWQIDQFGGFDVRSSSPGAVAQSLGNLSVNDTSGHGHHAHGSAAASLVPAPPPGMHPAGSSALYGDSSEYGSGSETPGRPNSRPNSTKALRCRGKVDKGLCERCGSRMRGFGAGYCTNKECRKQASSAGAKRPPQGFSTAL